MPKRGVRKKYFNCKIYLKLQQLSSPTGVSKNIKDKKPRPGRGREGTNKEAWDYSSPGMQTSVTN